MKYILDFKVKVLQKDGSKNSLLDSVAVEEPLEIREFIFTVDALVVTITPYFFARLDEVWCEMNSGWHRW